MFHEQVVYGKGGKNRKKFTWWEVRTLNLGAGDTAPPTGGATISGTIQFSFIDKKYIFTSLCFEAGPEGNWNTPINLVVYFFLEYAFDFFSFLWTCRHLFVSFLLPAS